jgi:hypothetical protein
MSQKLLIIVLVVLVVIFVITIGIGGCHASGSGKDPDHAGAVGALKGLQGKRFLKIGDKASTTCGVLSNEVGLVVNGTCTIKFEKRSFFSRSTRVLFVPSATIFVLVKPESGHDRTDRVDGGKCYGSAIDHAGGTMTLVGNATITFRRQECPKE